MQSISQSIPLPHGPQLPLKKKACTEVAPLIRGLTKAVTLISLTVTVELFIHGTIIAVAVLGGLR